MSQNQVQRGDVIEVTLATGVTAVAGQIHLGTNRAGVYLTSGSAGEKVSVALEGVFSVPKTASAGDALTVLDQVFAVATGGANEAQAAGTIALGYAVDAAATGATTANVKLAGF